MKRILGTTWRLLKGTVVGISLVLVLALWALRMPWAQEYLSRHAEEILSQELGAPVEVAGVDIHLPGKAVLRGVHLRDQHRRPMFSVRELRVNLLSLPLLSLITRPASAPPIRLNHVEVVQPEAHLARSRADSTWNYAFLIPASDSTPSKPPRFHLEFPDVDIRGGIFTMVDSTRSDSLLAMTQRINFFNLDLRALRARAAFRILPGMKMAGELHELSVIEERCRQMVQELSGNVTIDLKGSATRRLRICGDDIRLRTGRTLLRLDGDFADERPDSLRSGFHPAFSAHLRPSTFDFSTLNLFLPKPVPMRDPVQVRGYIWGDRNGIYSDSIDAAMYRHTRLRTAIALTNYMNAGDLGFRFDIGQGQVSFDELQLFLQGVKLPLRGIASMRGTVTGDLKKINTRNLRVSYLTDTDLIVDARIDDYQDEDNLFMTVRFKESHFSFVELRKLLPAMKLPDWMGRFGRCSIDGRFVGGISDFVVTADVGSGYGSVNTDLHLVLPPRAKDITYNGRLNATALNLAALNAELPVRIPYLNFSGDVNGHGAEWGEIYADINGKATHSNVNGFHLDQVQTDALRIEGHKITGTLRLADPEGNASVTVDITLPDTAHRFIVKGDLDRLDLAHYKIFPKDSVFLTTILNVNVAGDSIENYAGKLSFFLVNLVRQGTKDTVNLKNILLTSKFEPGWKRSITLRSSVADMRMKGTFSYKNAIRLVDRLGTETRLYIKNNDTLTARYYAEKVVVPENVTIDDTIETKAELNDLLAFFKVPLHLRPGTRIHANLRHGFMDEVVVGMRSDSIAYASVATIRDSLHLSFQKAASSNDLIGIGYLHLDTLKIGNSIRFADVELEPSAVTDELDCYLRARQPEQGNDVVLSTTTRFERNGEIRTQVSPGESHLGVRGRSWTFDPGNVITRRFEHPPSLGKRFPDSTIARYHVENLNLHNGQQRIQLSGVVSADTSDILTCHFDEVMIRSLVEVFSADSSIDGRIHDSNIKAWKLLSGQPNVYAGGYVDEFHYKNVDSIGIRFIGGWPYRQKADLAGLHAIVGHWGHDSLTVQGWYNFKKDELDFKADSSSFLVQWAQPFVEGMLSDMEGKVALDHFSVRGSLKRPLLNGSARFTGTRFKVDFLNNVFALSDNTLKFNNERIDIPRITVTDTSGGSALVSGAIHYSEEAGPRLDLKVFDIQDLTIMDTRKVHSDVFYGHLVLDGDSATVTGLITLPMIEAWVNTGDGSWLDIPLSSYTSATRLDFVSFIEGGKAPIRVEQEEGPAGFELALHVNARPNARARLIFDEFVGDIIEATGEGNINLFMDKNGELTMFGAYQVKEGDYHFTMENVLNKKFEVEEGGMIIWTGSPYEADLNLDAKYKVNADISALLPSASGGSRLPVEIIMHMEGNLNHPEIDLSLGMSKLNDQDVMGLESYFRGIQYDQQELNKQVVSLLMFRRFTGSQAFAGGGASSVNVTSSISELVSNQVNYWISQAFEDPNLGVEVNTNEFQDVELALRASLFNDRVTVERNGTIIGNSTNSFSLGDISVLIKLLPKADSTGNADPNAGQLVMEIFNREEASISARNNSSQGTGIYFKRDFDRIKELFGKKGEMKHEEHGQ